MVIGASDPALHDRKVAFDCIRMNIAANVLVDAVVDGLVLLELAADARATVIGIDG